MVARGWRWRKELMTHRHKWFFGAMGMFSNWIVVVGAQLYKLLKAIKHVSSMVYKLHLSTAVLKKERNGPCLGNNEGPCLSGWLIHISTWFHVYHLPHQETAGLLHGFQTPPFQLKFSCPSEYRMNCLWAPLLSELSMPEVSAKYRVQVLFSMTSLPE